MIREYISWIGIFSTTKYGLEMLESFKIFSSLRNLVLEDGSRDHIIILVLFCLDFGKGTEAESRNFL